jgi:chemotaxis protein CheD
MPAPDALLRPEVLVVRVSLAQGEIHCSPEPKTLVTVLGSCVAVCLWDRVRCIGGMNHFVLPNDPRGEKNARYGDFAIDQLVEGLLRLGCRNADLQAKVFGGAAVLPFAGGESVGSSNVRLALERLRFHRIPITAQRTGGTIGHQIRFNTRTGEVFFRRLRGGTQTLDIANLRLPVPQVAAAFGSVTRPRIR